MAELSLLETLLDEPPPTLARPPEVLDVRAHHALRMLAFLFAPDCGADAPSAYAGLDILAAATRYYTRRRDADAELKLLFDGLSYRGYFPPESTPEHPLFRSVVWMVPWLLTHPEQKVRFSLGPDLVCTRCARLDDCERKKGGMDPLENADLTYLEEFGFQAGSVYAAGEIVEKVYEIATAPKA